MLKTQTLIVFTQVALYQGFSAAARALGQTPMAISKQVSALEKQLGEPLFVRSTRQVKLTEFGEGFLRRAKQILEQHKQLEQWLDVRTETVSGRLTVVSQGALTFESTVFPWLGEFHRLYPHIELVFDLQEKAIDIAKDEFDIYWGVGEYLGDQHPGLVRRLMWRAPIGIYASPAYLERMGTPTTPDELAGHQVIGYPHEQPGHILVINETIDSQQTGMTYRHLDAPIKTVCSQTQLAEAGVGLINALTDNIDIVESVEKGTLVSVLEPYWYQDGEVYIYYQQVRYEQPKVRAFIDFFIGKRDDWL